MAEHASVIRVTHFQPLPGKHDELIARMQSGVAAIRVADGCFGVQMCDVRESPDLVAVVSRWVNQAALDVILNAGMMDLNVIKDLIAAPPTSEHLIPVAGGSGPDD